VVRARTCNGSIVCLHLAVFCSFRLVLLPPQLQTRITCQVSLRIINCSFLAEHECGMVRSSLWSGSAIGARFGAAGEEAFWMLNAHAEVQCNLMARAVVPYSHVRAWSSVRRCISPHCLSLASVITHVCPRQTIKSRKSRWRLTRGIRT